MVRSLLTESDAREVEAAVGRVEAQTAAEIVVAVLPQSQEYWQARALASLAWGLAAGFAFLHFEPWRHPALSLVVEVLVGSVTYALLGLPSFKRLLLRKDTAAGAVRARAFQLFAERGLYGTRGRTALLIFVSELEHQVVLLGDHHIHAELGQSGWDEQVALLVRHIREGKLREGLLAVLEHLAPHLARVAPRAAQDVNELPDTVVRS
jgi:putative membrane protein